MELSKIQKFLKTKHKFDKKPEFSEEFEVLNEKLQDIKRTEISGQEDVLKKKVGTFLIEFIKFCNNHELDISDIFGNVMGLTL